MWIFSRLGFFSVTCPHDNTPAKNVLKDRMQIRARSRAHLVNLLDAAGEGTEKVIDGVTVQRIHEMPERDYRFRINVSRDAWTTVFAPVLFNSIDYHNFKDSVHGVDSPTSQDKRYSDALFSCWSLMYAYQNRTLQDLKPKPLPVALPILTKLEREILNHRLEVPDAIADALEAPEDDVDDIASCLEKDNLPGALSISPELTFDVLEDAVTGSTYLGASIGQTSPAKERAIKRAGDALATKIGRMIGRKLVYPEA